MYKGKNRVSRKIVAIKIFDKTRLKECNINDARREAEIMKGLNHNNIV